MRSLVWSLLANLAAWTVVPHVTSHTSFCSASDGNPGKVESNPDGDGLFALQPCPARCVDVNETTTTTATNGNSRVFYLILIHDARTANDAVYLLRAIRDPRNVIVIHYDKKVEHLFTEGSAVLLQEVRSCPCGSRIRVESMHSVEWSKWSMNLPTLWGMELAVSPEYADHWDTFINLSGDTLPVYTVNTTASMLRDLPYNFVTSRSCETGLLPSSVYVFPKFWHKRRHYTVDETEADPVFVYTDLSTGERRNKTVTTHFGSQWVILQRPFVQWLMRQLRDDASWPSQFRDYLQTSGKLMTDETFVPTVLVNANDDDNRANFATTLPVVSDHGELLWRNGSASGILDVRFERMDEHFPTAFGVFPETQRYQVPDALVESNILGQPRPWGPYFLGVYDLGGIRETGALFARKISALVDPNLVRLLPVNRTADIPDIHWPAEVSLTDRPDWQAEMELWEKKGLVKSPTSSDDDEEL